MDSRTSLPASLCKIGLCPLEPPQASPPGQHARGARRSASATDKPSDALAGRSLPSQRGDRAKQEAAASGARRLAPTARRVLLDALQRWDDFSVGAGPEPEPGTVPQAKVLEESLRLSHLQRTLFKRASESRRLGRLPGS